MTTGISFKFSSKKFNVFYTYSTFIGMVINGSRKLYDLKQKENDLICMA